MSELKTNKISPSEGTTLTLGDSGDTVTIPVGTTLVGSGASLTDLPGASIPSGAMMDFAGAAAPDGWVFCDGTAYDCVNDTSFAELFSVISVLYGGSSGANFQVPDFRGRVSIGKDDLGGTSANRMEHSNADILGGSSGSETHALVTSELAAHTHNGAAHTHLVGLTNSSGSGSIAHRGSGGQQATVTSGNTYPGAGYSTGSSTAHRNDQPWVAVTKIIKK
tara:strand:+ start:1604 stop:2266 length:663 start_codon:yes stop_codon:yes gene_type:complete